MYIVLYVKCPLFFSDFNVNWVFAADFKTLFGIKFHENPSSGRRVVPCGRTDGHDEANSCSSQFCESAYKLQLNAEV